MKINELSVVWQMALDEPDFTLFSAAASNAIPDTDLVELEEIHAVAQTPMKDLIKQTGNIRNFSRATTIPYPTVEGWSRKPCPTHLKFLTSIAMGLLRVDN